MFIFIRIYLYQNKYIGILGALKGLLAAFVLSNFVLTEFHCTYVHTYILTFVHKCTHTYVHTYVHTYTYTYTVLEIRSKW